MSVQVYIIPFITVYWLLLLLVFKDYNYDVKLCLFKYILYHLLLCIDFCCCWFLRIIIMMLNYVCSCFVVYIIPFITVYWLLLLLVFKDYNYDVKLCLFKYILYHLLLCIDFCCCWFLRIIIMMLNYVCSSIYYTIYYCVLTSVVVGF